MEQFSENNYKLNIETIKEISSIKGEPQWMLEKRLSAFKKFKELNLPKWGPPLADLKFEDIRYYFPGSQQNKEWSNFPEEIKQSFEDIGVPQSERGHLAGISTQQDSEVVYTKLKRYFESKGVIFESIENGLKTHPEIFKEYFGRSIPAEDNKFTALNTAFWSGGSFVYVPKGVVVDVPIETYFRIDAKALGQFERTLIIADEGASVQYIEGCSAPQYLETSLHCGVVEIFAKKNSNVTYITIQNWSKNVFNLVTKRAIAEEGAHVSWIDCNIGSKVTMKYPTTILKGDNSHGYLTSLSIADSAQNIDSGGRMIHVGKDTKSTIISKSISSQNGITTFRGGAKVLESSSNSHSFISCDSLLLDSTAASYAQPMDSISNSNSVIEHEATASSISQKQLDYLMSKGFSEDESRDLIVQGFSKDILEQIPTEYSVEIQKILYQFSKQK